MSSFNQNLKVQPLNDQPDDVTIVPADRSLINKIGAGNLDKILSQEAIKQAEKVIINAAENLYVNCVTDASKLQLEIARLKQGGPTAEQALSKIISLAFAIKTKSGQSGYDLVSAICKSLHIKCEELPAGPVPPAVTKIIEWHVNSIVLLLAKKTKGDGGDVGKAILAEIEKISLDKEPAK